MFAHEPPEVSRFSFSFKGAGLQLDVSQGFVRGASVARYLGVQRGFSSFRSLVLNYRPVCRGTWSKCVFRAFLSLGMTFPGGEGFHRSQRPSNFEQFKSVCSFCGEDRLHVRLLRRAIPRLCKSLVVSSRVHASAVTGGTVMSANHCQKCGQLNN